VVRYEAHYQVRYVSHYGGHYAAHYGGHYAARNEAHCEECYDAAGSYMAIGCW
jgi:hypothetical protein